MTESLGPADSPWGPASRSTLRSLEVLEPDKVWRLLLIYENFETGYHQDLTRLICHDPNHALPPTGIRQHRAGFAIIRELASFAARLPSSFWAAFLKLAGYCSDIKRMKRSGVHDRRVDLEAPCWIRTEILRRALAQPCICNSNAPPHGKHIRNSSQPLFFCI